MQVTTTFATERGPQLLGTMAKHFGHKIPVEQSDTRATFGFEAGTGVVALTGVGLELSAEGPTEDDARRVADVLERHLVRFAHRDDPQPLDWFVVPTP